MGQVITRRVRRRSGCLGLALVAAAICAVALPPSHEIVDRLTAQPRVSVASALALVAAFCVLTVGNGAPASFIYFQF